MSDDSDDSGNKTAYEYDDLDQITKMTHPDPDDGTGSLTSPVTNYSYDVFGRLVTVTDPENGLTNVTYDKADNLLTLKDSVNNVTTFAYDGRGQRTMETNELGDGRSFYYDSSGRRTRRVDRNEQIRQFAYDELGHTNSEKWFENGTPVPTISIATTTEGGVTDEVQRVGFSDDMSMLYGGTFTLTFDGQTTSEIAGDASDATVQSALEALSNIDAGEVTVTKTREGMDTEEWQLIFAGELAGTNVAQTTVDSSNVTGMGTVTDIEATDIQGGTTNDEVQTVTLANADDGTFRLAFQGQTTAALAYDATAAQVETAFGRVERRRQRHCHRFGGRAVDSHLRGHAFRNRPATDERRRGGTDFGD
ncbi:MAG: hypothetical protein WD070_03260 [Pirellulaceae bacterium]